MAARTTADRRRPQVIAGELPRPSDGAGLPHRDWAIRRHGADWPGRREAKRVIVCGCGALRGPRRSAQRRQRHLEAVHAPRYEPPSNPGTRALSKRPCPARRSGRSWDTSSPCLTPATGSDPGSRARSSHRRRSPGVSAKTRCPAIRAASGGIPDTRADPDREAPDAGLFPGVCRGCGSHASFGTVSRRVALSPCSPCRSSPTMDRARRTSLHRRRAGRQRYRLCGADEVRRRWAADD